LVIWLSDNGLLTTGVPGGDWSRNASFTQNSMIYDLFDGDFLKE